MPVEHPLLDSTKRLTNVKLGFPDEERLRLIVWDVEEKYGERYRFIHDIVEGPRVFIVRYFNRERTWWGDNMEIKVEKIVVSKH